MRVDETKFVGAGGDGVSFFSAPHLREADNVIVLEAGCDLLTDADVLAIRREIGVHVFQNEIREP